MPDSPATRQSDFDPEATEAMALAFDKTCLALGLSEVPDSHTTKTIAGKIVDFARGGERDPEQLCALTVQAMTRHEKS